MSRRKLSTEEKTARLERRAAAREETAARVADRRSWHESHANAAKEWLAKRAKKRAKAKAKAARKDRAPRVAVLPHERGKIRPGYTEGQPIDSTLGTSVIAGRKVTANYADRRRAGARGEHPYGTTRLHRPRRRTLPAHEARALERARRDNVGAW